MWQVYRQMEARKWPRWGIENDERLARGGVYMEFAVRL